jgi:hypothetical protein
LSYSFFTLAEPHGFTRTQLKQLGANGIWIIGNNSNGVPSNLRQVTSLASGNVNQDEESIIANVDNIALSISHIGENLVGCSNITRDLIASLYLSLTLMLTSKTINNSNDARIGAQLTDYVIDSIAQDEVALDHVYASFTITPPKPFNKFHMSMRIV